MLVLKSDIQEAAGPLQVSSGLQSGGEAAIHSMKDLFMNEDTEGVILVDACNAFNSLNRKVALHNIQYMCPDFAKILINTYRWPSRLFVMGGYELRSNEGDNLAMSFYALGTKMLITTLKSLVNKLNRCG